MCAEVKTTYTKDFKRRAVARLANGALMEDVAAAVGVSKSTVWRWRAALIAERKALVEASRKEPTLLQKMMGPD